MILNPPKVERPQKYVISYLDMLGTTAKIAREDNYLFLDQLYSIYNTAVQQSENELLRKSRYGKIVTKIFSDNIIMAIPLNSSDDINDILNLMRFTSFFQYFASLINRWPVRGGITIGELFIDKIMVWGKGLVRAYTLEDKLAIFPRIIIDHNIIQQIGTKNSLVRLDSDGWFYLDFLNSMNFQDQHEFVSGARDSFADLLSEIRDKDGTYRERPYQKLQWYKTYLNQWYNEHYVHEDDEVLIDESALVVRNNTPERSPS